MEKNKTKLEKKRLEKIAINFSMTTGFNGRLEKYRVLTIKDSVRGDDILDVGCADGLMSIALAKYFKHITAIDGSKKLIDGAKSKNIKNIDFICTLFEEFTPIKKFDSVILSDILEHVQDPIQLLIMAKDWVKDDGVIVLLCPNANSVHRQVGALAGMLNDIHDINATDIKVGHRRVYDIKLLTKDLNAAGLKIKKWGGMFFKPLSNDQMNQLEDKVVDAFYLVGKKLPPEILTEIYVQCTK